MIAIRLEGSASAPNAAIFSVVNAVLLRSLPYPDSSPQWWCGTVSQKSASRNFRFPMPITSTTKRGIACFEDVAAFSAAEFNVAAADQAERVPCIRVSSNY